MLDTTRRVATPEGIELTLRLAKTLLHKGALGSSLLLPPAQIELVDFIEQVLRDVKAALESGKGNFARRVEAFEPTQATGTYGPTSPNPRFGTPTIPVEFTRPPESKS